MPGLHLPHVARHDARCLPATSSATALAGIVAKIFPGFRLDKMCGAGNAIGVLHNTNASRLLNLTPAGPEHTLRRGGAMSD